LNARTMNKETKIMLPMVGNRYKSGGGGIDLAAAA
jgi:hypothetical protein